MGICGSGTDHCCYYKGQVCQYLIKETKDGRNYQCSLRDELGSWVAVHADKRYIDNIKPLWVALGRPDMNCGDYPAAGDICHDCGFGVK